MRPAPFSRLHYPVDEWRLVERGLAPRDRPPHAETLFAVGNGYLGLRGNDDEGGQAHEHGTFINGFHETWPIHYAESAYGFANVGQTILNVPDAKTVELLAGHESLDLNGSHTEAYSRVLDMRHGRLERSVVWHLAAGGRVLVESSRLVSFENRHLALMSCTVTALDGPVELAFRSRLVDRQSESGDRAGAGDPAAPAGFDPRVAEDMTGALQPRLHGVTESGATYLAHATRSSELGVVVMAAHSLEGADADPELSADPRHATTTYRFLAPPNAPVTLHKLVAYHDGGAQELEGLIAAARDTLASAAALGPAGIVAGQSAWLAAFWEDADVTVPGQPALQQALRWNLFQVLQAAARADGRGVSAKGVTGSGYSGHYFWDTEIYVLPFLAHTRPTLARNALVWRHTTLPAARRRARTMSEAGALFPWRTINGEEASAYYPAGTAQYHINADVAYALSKYVAATADDAFMARYGAEILIETARLWLSLGFHQPATGRFHINGVTGPDEYSAVVDDNFYTNIMAAFNLRRAARAVDELAASAPEAHARLVKEVGVTPAELSAWRRAAEEMELPYDDALGVHLQDARWLAREPWDVAGTPPEKRPLLLHYHPLVIYRHQVLKQADLVLALYLQGRSFTLEQKRRDFDLYDPLTTGDSSLSAAVQAIVAAEVGYPERALGYFEKLLYADLADLHGNTVDGVHVASAGGSWQAVVNGFGGMRDDGGTLRFDPRLPAGWRELGFLVRTGGAKVRVRLTQGSVTFTLEEGAAAEFELRGRPVRLTDPDPLTLTT